jgi:hypothetical protein
MTREPLRATKLLFADLRFNRSEIMRRAFKAFRSGARDRETGEPMTLGGCEKAQWRHARNARAVLIERDGAMRSKQRRSFRGSTPADSMREIRSRD